MSQEQAMDGLPAPNPYRLESWHFGVSIGAFGLAALMGMLQALTRANFELPIQSEKLYYILVTAHGVIMALVFTTYFIMGLGYLIARKTLGRLEWEGFAYFCFHLGLVGTGMAALAILSGSSTVLYTFYPPLQAHWSFYLGATLLVVASWGFCAVMIRSYLVWRKERKEEPVPLPFHGMMATVIIWILATSGLAAEVVGMLLPWSLGLIDKVDPIVARTWFWWFGHPLTYFWLVPAYVIWYTIVPRAIGGRLFSEPLARVVFVMFILFSTPVGFHHQFADPGISAGWKMAHTVSTYMILFPSLVTAFTVIASFEVAGRLKGARGLFDWLGKLPWKDPFFASVALAMVSFAVGGFGGAINAAYAMNTMVHNTSWIQGHFHLTVGTAVALSFMGVTYWLLPRLSGKPLRFAALGSWQPYLWFLGMLLFSFTTHITGIMGMPRRIYTGAYLGSPVAKQWEFLSYVSGVGGVVLTISAAFFLLVVLGTLAGDKRLEKPLEIEFARPIEAPAEKTGIWDRFGLWATIAVILIVIAYAYPMYHLFHMPRFGSTGWKPF
jgi:cytochrome c oxidase subunit 1